MIPPSFVAWLGGFCNYGTSSMISSAGVNYKISVPECRMWFLCWVLMSNLTSFSSRLAIPSLTSGYDSPVRMASFTTTEPLRISKSHGTAYFFLWRSRHSITTSFGYSSSLGNCIHLFDLCTQTCWDATLICLSRLKLFNL